MATLKELSDRLELALLTDGYDETRAVTDAYVCDLLSWVMAKGRVGMAWITVQTHINVLAVASLHDFSCVIVPEGIQVPEETVKRANEEKITVFSSQHTAYELCRGMDALGIGD